MIGVVVVSHGRLADEFVAATEHVVGPMDAFLAVCIGPDDDMEKRRSDIKQAIADADRGEGVLVLTDMFGGTPSNLAISLLEPGKVDRRRKSSDADQARRGALACRPGQSGPHG